MADFPQIDAADPSAEEEKANQRSLTLGLIAGGLGILAQPRWRGESKIAPVARGALGGLNAYEGSMADSADQRYRNRQQQIEQQRYSSEAGFRGQQLGIEQQNADTSAANAKTQEQLRKDQAAQLEPVGADFGDPFATLRKDPRLASALSMIPPEAVANMSRKDIHDLRTELVKGTMTGEINNTRFQPMGDGIHKIVVDKSGNTLSDEIIGPNKEGASGKETSPETIRKNLTAEATKQFSVDPMMSSLRHPLTAKPSLKEYIAAYFKDHGKNLDGTPISGGAEAGGGGTVAGISVGDPAKKSDGTTLADGPHKLPSGAQFVVKGGKVVSVGASPALAMSSDAHGPTLPPTAGPSGPPLPPPPGMSAPSAAPTAAPMAPPPARPMTVPPSFAAPAGPNMTPAGGADLASLVANPGAARAPVAPPAAAKPLPMHAKLGKTGKPLKDGSGNYAFTDGKFLYKAKSPAGPFIPLGPDPDAAKGA